MKKWQKFTEEEIRKIVSESTTYSEIVRKLGYNLGPKGGAQANSAKEIIKYYNIDDSHLKGQDWKKDNYDLSRFKFSNIKLKPANLYPALNYIRGHKCEICKNTEWLGKPIQLEVHHIDGDRYNNNLDNLQLLCPNCHSCTPNWMGKRNKNGRKGNVSEEELVEALKSTSSIKEALLKVNLKILSDNKERAKKLIIKYDIINQEEYNSLKDNIYNKKKYLYKIDPKTLSCICKFNTIKEAILSLGLKGNNTFGINNAIKNHTLYHNYYWERREEE